MAQRSTRFTRTSAMKLFKKYALAAQEKGEWFGRQDVAALCKQGIMPGPSWYRTYCGKFTDMRKELGLPSNQKRFMRSLQLETDEYIQPLLLIAELNTNGTLTIEEWERQRPADSLPHSRLTTAYGSWPAVLEKAAAVARAQQAG